MAKTKETGEKIRTTVYLDKGILKKLKMKAIEEEKSVSEMLEELAEKKIGGKK